MQGTELDQYSDFLRDAPPLEFVSSIPGMAWPAFPGPRRMTLLALLMQFETTQWWSPEAIRERQFRQLEALLAHCVAQVPYYRERLEAAGYRPGAALTPETWRRIEPLERGELQRAGAALASAAFPESHGRTIVKTSSGSTGTPVEVTVTESSGLIWHAGTLRDLLWHRRDPAGKLAAVRGRMPKAQFPKGLSAKSWGPPVDRVFRTGPAVALTSATPIPQQVDWLRRQNPDYLVTMPQNLFALAEYCRQEGIELPALRDISTYGGVVRPEDRQACRDAWEASVSDIYSAEETGYIALQCPERPVYHVQAETALVEVIDERGRPCGPGETGRVIVTPLHHYAMPLLRYDIGDYAVVGEACACGRGLPVLQSVIGRARDMLTLPDGARISPAFVGGLFKGLPVIQFQVAQLAPDHLEARIVPKLPMGEAEEVELKRSMRARLPADFRITVTYHEELPRSAGDKYQDFKSEMA